MRKFVTLAALAALAAGAIPVLAAGACEDSHGRSQADPFGACESTSGNVTCNGAAPAPAPGVGTYSPSASGAAVCVGDESAAPLEGRYGVSNKDGRVTAYADMGDEHAARTAVDDTDWVRADVYTSNPRVCLYRGGAGSAWLSGSGHDPSAENIGEPLLEPVSAGPAGNPAPGLGDTGFSQCFLGLGVPQPPDPSTIPTTAPTPLPTTVPTVPTGVPTVPTVP